MSCNIILNVMYMQYKVYGADLFPRGCKKSDTVLIKPVGLERKLLLQFCIKLLMIRRKQYMRKPWLP